MRGTSQASLDAVEGRWEPVLEAAGEQATVLGEELYALVDALDASGSLRRVLADPSAAGEAKAALVARLLAAADARTVAVAQDLVRSRWSADADLADAAQRLGTSAVLAAAQSAGTLEQVEQELFAVIGALSGQRDLRRALFDPSVPGEARADLAERVLGSHVSATTLLLARRAAAAPRGRRYVAWLGDVVDLIAERRHHRVATVTVAAPLSDAQRGRLAGLLATALGRQVELDVVVDPRVIGGLRVQSGPDVIDSTVLARLADARRQLAG
ncbi:F0F1 ATP synthase subunit delta [Cellulomonas sp. SG140]|uniref:F0F1 ATP synthase subunit delta n=1 Tax=Cellulomonas sp. SG140 TaxID=2976536 RepID=UPI0021E87308|nr:F0F1 ATP synthase subunit delta [Cellulomonas sp. SG140]